MAVNVYNTCIRNIDRRVWTRSEAIEQATKYHNKGFLTDTEFNDVLEYARRKLTK